MEPRGNQKFKLSPNFGLEDFSYATRVIKGQRAREVGLDMARGIRTDGGISRVETVIDAGKALEIARVVAKEVSWHLSMAELRNKFKTK